MRRFPRFAPAFLPIVGLFLTGNALAAAYSPDPHFSRAFHGPGFNDYVRCAGTWGANLVVGGPFTQFNGTLTGSLATWTAPDWTTLGFPFAAQPYVIREFGGKLYVGGYGINNDGSGNSAMAIYNGSSWTTTPPGNYTVCAVQEYGGVLHIGGTGLPSGGRGTAVWNGAAFVNPGSTLPGTVQAFTLYGGDLIAAGYFAAEGGNGIQSVGRYDGTIWSSLGTGLMQETMPAQAWTAVEFQGDLIVGGAITSAGGTPVHNVARWNGSTWSDMGTALGSPGTIVWSLAVYNNELYAAVRFSSAATEAPNVFKWNGADWVTVGTGHPFGTFQQVYDLEVQGGRLHVVGKGGVAAWDGTSWSLVGVPRDGGLDNAVLCLTMYDGNLIASGPFTHAGGVPANHIARWDGSQWHPLGAGRAGTPVAMTVHGGRLYAAGTITSTWKIGAWDGVAWQDIDQQTSYGNIYAMASFNGDLVVGGDFGSIGGIAANNIARWDGTAWHPLEEGITGCDSPSIPVVRSLAVLDGDLYVGGTFTQAGTWTVGHVARWDGTTWYRLSPQLGVTDPCLIQWLSDVYSFASVNGLAPWAGGMAIGGHFGHVANLTSPLAARWAPGWNALSGTITFDSWPGAIHGLANHNGTLFAAGLFSTAASGSSSFSRWTGTDWEPMGIDNDEARAIVSDGNFVYVGGRFTEAGGVSSNRIAAWSALPVSGVGEPGSGAPRPEQLFTVRPNPTRGAVTIRFSLAAAGPVVVDVYDVAGRRVQVLGGGSLDAGVHELTWNGRDIQGRGTSAGVYFLKLRTAEGTRVQRVIRVE